MRRLVKTNKDFRVGENFIILEGQYLLNIIVKRNQLIVEDYQANKRYIETQEKTDTFAKMEQKTLNRLMQTFRDTASYEKLSKSLENDTKKINITSEFIDEKLEEEKRQAKQTELKFINEEIKKEEIKQESRFMKLAKNAFNYKKDEEKTIEIEEKTFDQFDEMIANTTEIYNNSQAEENTAIEVKEIPQDLQSKVDELKKLDNLNIEIVGCFIWVSGDTYQHKNELKALGLKWSGKRKMWYFGNMPKWGTYKGTYDEMKSHYNN